MIERIRAGSLLPASLFADLDCDAVLDARDSDVEFEQDWSATSERLAAKWKASRPGRAARAAIEDLRRESFFTARTVVVRVG